MSNFNSRTPYEGAEMGGGREHAFQLKRRRHTVKPLVLAYVANGRQQGVASASVRVRMTCPDERLLCTLVIQYVPRVTPAAIPPASTDPDLPDTLHLMACADLGDGPHPVEDLFGTRDAPQLFVRKGLWGFQYSPTEEVREMWADLVLTANIDPTRTGGDWRVGAIWTAAQPMSEEDWREAVSLMMLSRSPEPVNLIIPG